MNEVTYTAKVIAEIDNGPNHWKNVRVGVFAVQNGIEQQVGAYLRNYPALANTFCHFQKDGRDYALYSPHYTVTRIMELPSCQDLGGEKSSSSGFCPVDYFVPPPHEVLGPAEEEFVVRNYGFVAGCYWGGPVHIQFLDLSEGEKGIIKRDARFGLIELPEKITLEQAISLETYSVWDEKHHCWRDTVEDVRIAIEHVFDLRDGKMK